MLQVLLEALVRRLLVRVSALQCFVAVQLPALECWCWQRFGQKPVVVAQRILCSS